MSIDWHLVQWFDAGCEPWLPCDDTDLELGRESSARPALAALPETAPASPPTTGLPLHGGGRNLPSHDPGDAAA